MNYFINYSKCEECLQSDGCGDSTLCEGFQRSSIESWVTKLYPEQVNALFPFLSRENVFVNLPTSYGKSMIFQIAPLVASELSKSCTQFEAHCIIIVISPLVALMNDQVGCRNPVLCRKPRFCEGGEEFESK